MFCAYAPAQTKNDANGKIYTVPKIKLDATQPIGSSSSGPAASEPKTQHGGFSDTAALPRTRESTGREPVNRVPDKTRSVGVDAPPLTEQVARRNIGSEKFQQLLTEIANGDQHARGAPTASVWYDGGIPSSVQAGHGTGTRFFESSSTVDARGIYEHTTVDNARKAVQKYGSQGGGIVLEGVAAGLGRLDQVRYDTRFNAFIVDERAAYFMRVPPETVAVICRSIARDKKERLGVSLGAKMQLFYGDGLKQFFADSALAWDLKMADHFLGDIVFAGNDWSARYKFADGYKPASNSSGNAWSGCVYFVFNAAEFAVENDEIKLRRSDLRVTLVPLSDKPAPDGGFLPDYDAIPRGGVPQSFEQNAEHLGNNIGYYRRERLVGKMFAYAEVASFIRALKKAGFDLESLASHVPGG